MSDPQYKVFGMERRNLKKKLSQIKSYVKNFWYYHQLEKDMHSFYGGPKSGATGSYPMSDNIAQKKFDQANKQISAIEAQLAVPYK